MKKACLIFIALLTMANTFAGNNAANTTAEGVAIERETADFSCVDCLLSFDKTSKVVISDEDGHVIFYNESVQNLDLSSWNHGSYIVKVNDSDSFELTI